MYIYIYIYILIHINDIGCAGIAAPLEGVGASQTSGPTKTFRFFIIKFSSAFWPDVQKVVGLHA